MERYLMYLRKSRMDTDFDEISVEETLDRHRRILVSFCKERRLNVVEELKEVVSGESLASRPKMMRLLELVNTGMYAGVVCVDIERLSRGSSLESGYIMQVLQTNSCKIITPSKIYDLQNESDEQFTDMKFMFSRYELKTITKRLVRGKKSISLRLDKAIEYLRDNPETKCIVSGGQGENESKPEAEVMAQYLIENGISTNRIIQENQSMTTEENLKNSIKLMEEQASVGIVTNNFHLFRALQLAKRLNIKNVYGIAASSTFFYLPNNLLREFLAYLKFLLL